MRYDGWMDEEESIIEDSLNYKHHALIGVGVLLLALVVISIAFQLTRHSSDVVVVKMATSTPSQTGDIPANATSSLPHKISTSDHGQYYDITIAYPSSAGLPGQTDAQAVTFMKGFVQNTIDAFKENGNFAKLTPADVKMQKLDHNKYSLGIDYVTYHGARTVSYVYTIVEDTGGAHPNTFYRTFTFDTQNGGSLGLGGLFTTGTKYLDLLSKQARTDLPAITKKLSGMAVDTKSIVSGTQPQEDSFQNFAIDGNTLRVIFPPYQVGPYSLGTVVDPIPLTLKAFKGLVRPQYIGS